MLKRVLDIVISLLVLSVMGIPGAFLGLLIRLTSGSPVIYWSERVGRWNKIFRMPKFRTMRVDTPAVATHLFLNPDVYITTLGKFLRRTSLDELPQIWSILVGDMSVVGPRPALFNQNDLIALRTDAGIDTLIPGLTGWAQVNGRDELSISEKVKFDVEYMQRQSLWFDLKIILLTIVRAFTRKNVAH